MSRELLTAVMSHDRLPYLRNTVESLLSTFRLGDVLVVDDNSSDEALLDYLEELEGRGVRVSRRGNEAAGDKLGLYPGMNFAARLAQKEGYHYLQILQDDLQFMWHDPELLRRIETVFAKRSDAVEVALFFHGKIHRHMHDAFSYDPEVGCYRNGRHGLSDIGIYHVERLLQDDFEFQDEGISSTIWREKGYRIYHLRDPVLAFVPWPPAFRYGKLAGPMHPPPFELYLRPMTDRQVRRLKARDPAVLPYHEDYCRPWGWAALSPYWYTRVDHPDYVRHLAANARRGRPYVPRWTFAGRPRFALPPVGDALSGVGGAAAKLAVRRIRPAAAPQGP